MKLNNSHGAREPWFFTTKERNKALVVPGISDFNIVEAITTQDTPKKRPSSSRPSLTRSPPPKRSKVNTASRSAAPLLPNTYTGTVDAHLVPSAVESQDRGRSYIVTLRLAAVSCTNQSASVEAVVCQTSEVMDEDNSASIDEENESVGTKQAEYSDSPPIGDGDIEEEIQDAVKVEDDEEATALEVEKAEAIEDFWTEHRFKMMLEASDTIRDRIQAAVSKITATIAYAENTFYKVEDVDKAASLDDNKAKAIQYVWDRCRFKLTHGAGKTIRDRIHAAMSYYEICTILARAENTL